jgi:2'-5' RNA ligase
MRLFTAIDIPEDVRANLQALLGRWKPLARIQWSPVANLHITTKFIGEWPEARIEELKTALSAIPRKGAFEIAVRGLGWFPNDRRPRILWAGVVDRGADAGADAGASLANLARTTEQAVTVLGVPVEERPFSPHLTLARIREAVPLDALRSAIAQTAADFGACRATEFFLYLSAGGKYTRLAAFPL